jgi:hypothetical protein
MERSNLGVRSAARAAVLLAAALCSASRADAQLVAGDAVPRLRGKSSNGEAVEVSVVGGKLTVRSGDEVRTPAALIVHFLQPDCLQCRSQVRALGEVARARAARGLVAVGVAYRGAVIGPDFAELAGPGWILATAPRSAELDRLGAGDASVLADAGGVVRFAQVGFGLGDEVDWAEAADAVLDGRAPAKATVGRRRLVVGETVPSVELPSLHSDRPMTLAVEGGSLVFRGDDGKAVRPKAAIGFFSRY